MNFKVSLLIFYIVLFFSEFQARVFLENRKENVGVRVNIDSEVDRILNIFSRVIVAQNLDPLNIPNVTLATTLEKPFSVPIKIELDGWLQDMHLISRNGECYIYTGINNQDVLIPVLVPVFEFGFNYKTQFGVIKPHGGILGRVENFEIAVKANFNIVKRQLTLISSNVSNIGKIKIKLTGHPIVNGWENIFLDATTDVLHGLIVDVVNITAPLVIDAAFNDINKHLHHKIFENIEEKLNVKLN